MIRHHNEVCDVNVVGQLTVGLDGLQLCHLQTSNQAHPLKKVAWRRRCELAIRIGHQATVPSGWAWFEVMSSPSQ